jgi:hypothetical protein
VTGLPDLESTIARLEQATAEAREVTRDLHSAIKSARQVERAVGDLITKARADIPRIVDETIGRAIDDGFAAHEQAMKEMIDANAAALSRSVNLVLYGNPAGNGPTIFDRVAFAVDRAEAVILATGGVRPINSTLPRL